jgi:hypothetical protein
MKNNRITRLYAKLVSRARGIPVMLVIYKRWNKGDNVFVASMAPFENDEYLAVRFKEIADHVRNCYQKDLDEILKEKELR